LALCVPMAANVHDFGNRRGETAHPMSSALRKPPRSKSLSGWPMISSKNIPPRTRNLQFAIMSPRTVQIELAKAIRKKVV
jgi:hypothetical protein